MLEDAFLRHRPPKHLISDREGVFTSEAFAELPADWDVEHRLGAVGRHGSTVVTERLIWTLKHEWLARVALIRDPDHLGQLPADSREYYSECRPHRRLGGATPVTVYQRRTWQKPDRTGTQVTCPIRLRHFREQRITVHEPAA